MFCGEVYGTVTLVRCGMLMWQLDTNYAVMTCHNN